MSEPPATDIEFDEGERPARALTGLPLRILEALAIGLSLYALFWVLNPIPAQIYRTSFLAVALAMTFVAYRGWKGRSADRPHPLDWALAAASVVALGYTLVFFEAFVRRTVTPTDLDVVLGVVTTLLVLEATRRTVGIILPLIALGFVAYAYLGGLIPARIPLAHIGYGLERIVGQTYMGLEGLFGTALDVAATYIILFTLYGAVLELSGAGRFFVEVSAAAFGKSRSGAGRTAAAAGFLLGTVSGSGTATTVTLGSVAWPLLKRAGYPAEAGGGVLAAAGIGAILSPPTLGAAAFIIAELLGVSYLKVLVYALVPSLLYYLGIVLAVEADARRMQGETGAIEARPLGRLLLRYGYHFSSLFLIVVLMALGYSPFRAVLLAMVAAVALSFLDREHAITPKRALRALIAGAVSVLPVAATTACAGVIVAVVTLTGLGLKLAGLIVAAAGGSLFLTALYSAFAVLLLGLAVPVTASFIIAAAVIAPAMTTLGVAPFVAYMFIFYYAVLSEVSPPTALAAVAASAVTGGRIYPTMMHTWKYTLPAFLVPFAFVLSPNGKALLLQADAAAIVFALAAMALSVAALSIALFGWLKDPVAWPIRAAAAAAGLALMAIDPVWSGAGAALFAATAGGHLLWLRRAPATTREPPSTSA